MRPSIDGTAFGSVTIAGEVYEHDVVIRLGGEVKKRKKKLSKAQYGTSHKVSRKEAEHIFEAHGCGTGARMRDVASHDYLRLRSSTRHSAAVVAPRSVAFGMALA
jgi:hypothetical protein